MTLNGYVKPNQLVRKIVGQIKEKCIMLGKFPFNNTPSFVNQIEWKDTPLQVKFEFKKK